MPYSIVTKDGITINNIPDNVPRDAPELQARVAAIRAERATGTGTAPQAAPAQAAPPVSQGQQLLQDLQPLADIPANLVGAAETAGSLATGAVIAPLTGLGGLLKQYAQELLAGNQIASEPAQTRIRQAAEAGFQAGTYQPQTQAGQQMTAAVGKVLQPVGEALLPLGPLAAEASLPGRGIAPRAATRTAAIPETPAAAIIEETIPEVVVSARRLGEAPEPATMTPRPAAAPQMTPTQLTETARTAVGEGIGAGRATRVLAEQAAPDPKVVESATRLGILEYLQPDHLTTNQAYRELAQAIKSQPGSQTRATEIQASSRKSRRSACVCGRSSWRPAARNLSEPSETTT